MPPVGFETTIPASTRAQTYALDHAATGIGYIKSIKCNSVSKDLLCTTSNEVWSRPLAMVSGVWSFRGDYVLCGLLLENCTGQKLTSDVQVSVVWWYYRCYGSVTMTSTARGTADHRVHQAFVNPRGAANPILRIHLLLWIASGLNS
jgi:hypothetical protein